MTLTKDEIIQLRKFRLTADAKEIEVEVTSDHLAWEWRDSGDPNAHPLVFAIADKCAEGYSVELFSEEFAIMDDRGNLVWKDFLPKDAADFAEKYDNGGSPSPFEFRIHLPKEALEGRSE